MVHTKSISTGHGKAHKWVVTPKPGTHKKKESLPLLLIVRDILKLADNAREAEKIIRSGLITVDGVPKKKHNDSVGLMDVVSIRKIQKHFRMLPAKQGLHLKEIPDKEANIKLRKIVGKKTLKGGKTQLLLHDGKTMLVEKGAYGVGDTLVEELDSGKITKTFELKEGKAALVTSGVHSGMTGKIVEVLPATAARKSLTKVGESQTLSAYVFVVGDANPAIEL